MREWFSASDGIDLREFVQLISERNQDRLMEEAGACIVYTHLAFRFCCKGKIDPVFAGLIRRLSRLPGYFVPVSELLNHLKVCHGVSVIFTQPICGGFNDDGCATACLRNGSAGIPRDDHSVDAVRPNCGKSDYRRRTGPISEARRTKAVLEVLAHPREL